MPAPLDPVLSRLFARTTHGVRPGTERIAAILERLGHPERSFLSIHVAGTNGKGSVCAMIEAALRAAGARTGLYTSPHLVRFHERIRVAGRPIDDAGLASLIEDVDEAAVEVARTGGGEATFFELGTAMAFEWFRRSGVQTAVVETGLGGRLDATNTILPVVSAITDIDLDHCEYLGLTVGKVAAEKAGIIKPGRPVIIGDLAEEAARVVIAAAAERGAPVIPASEAVSLRRTPRGFDGQKLSISTGGRAVPPFLLPLCGRHQAANAAIAVAAVETFADTVGADLPDRAFAGGLSSVVWPARLQRLMTGPDVILDGAHNPHGARALRKALDECGGGRPVGLIAGLLGDKDADGWFRAMAPVARRTWIVPVRNERGADPAELAETARRAGLNAEVSESPDSALAAARAWAATAGGYVCVAGSLYLAGEMLAAHGDGRRLFMGSEGDGG